MFVWCAKRVPPPCRDVEESLREVASRYLVSDIREGVVLNIAPLHELVPWKEVKIDWDQILGREYEWSSIDRQLRDKGLVK